MKSLFAGLLMWGLAGAALAEAVDTRPPDVMVREVTEQLQAEIGKRRAELKEDPAALQALIDELVVPYFDVPRIARLVLGTHGRNATEEQMQRFSEAFKTMLFRSYATALVDYHDSVTIEWRPLRMAEDATRTTVQSTLIRKDGPPVPVGFVLQKLDSGWKVFDVTVENISLVSNFRAQINGEIAKNGLDAVIQRLEGGDIDPADAVGDAG
jgi:phospholipid transport system substrate-binding protein